jgi:hypothetical protein
MRIAPTKPACWEDFVLTLDKRNGLLFGTNLTAPMHNAVRGDFNLFLVRNLTFTVIVEPSMSGQGWFPYVRKGALQDNVEAWHFGMRYAEIDCTYAVEFPAYTCWIWPKHGTEWKRLDAPPARVDDPWEWQP